MSNKKEIFYLETDELNLVDAFVRKVLYNFDNIELVISGSNSKFLSKEMAISLRWSSLIYKVFLSAYVNFGGIL